MTSLNRYTRPNHRIDPQTPHSGQNSASAASFSETLRRYREDVGLSQSRLAALSGYNHGFISKLCAGERNPSRDAVLNLAMAMGLDEADTDRLLASAGFMPRSVTSLLEMEPVVAGLYRLLSDPETDPGQAQVVRATVAALIGDDE